jgi:hypothetical protein
MIPQIKAKREGILAAARGRIAKRQAGGGWLATVGERTMAAGGGEGGRACLEPVSKLLKVSAESVDM